MPIVARVSNLDHGPLVVHVLPQFTTIAKFIGTLTFVHVLLSDENSIFLIPYPSIIHIF